MKYLLSMDGGGTKTAWLLTTESGDLAATYKTEGCSHLEKGVERVLDQIHEGIREVTKLAEISKEDIIGAAFGVPCFGEYPAEDKIISDDLYTYLKNTAVSVHNDVDLGFAGSLCLEDGIHVVAGTGAIAVGKNGENTARSNGWHPSFSDEGSGYWLGMQTLSLFAKQADCRISRSALYDIMKREFSFEKDEDVIAFYDKVPMGDRKTVASLQLILNKAADAGDESALKLYEAAAYELYLSVLGVYRALGFSSENRIQVSYSGGLFSADGHVLTPFEEFMSQLNADLKKPYLTPDKGGILLAMKNISTEKAKRIIQRLKAEQI